MTSTDERFVAASWFESFWKARAQREGIDFEAYKAGQDAIIRRLMRDATIMVAYAANVPDEIAGYSVVEDDTLHYVYVKAAYRRMGIGGGLVPEGLKFYTHDTGRQGHRFVVGLKLSFNPYRLLPREKAPT